MTDFSESRIEPSSHYFSWQMVLLKRLESQHYTLGISKSRIMHILTEDIFEKVKKHFLNLSKD